MPLFASAGALAAPVILGSGVLTASAPIFDLSQTWNNGAVAFTGFKLNITQTAVGSGSMFVDFQKNSTSVFSVVYNGGYRSLPGTTSEGSFGYFDNGFTFGGAVKLLWESGIPAGAPDLGLYRNAAGVFEINNGTPGTYRDLKLRHEIATGLFATAAAAPTIASAGTIAPTTPIVFISGTAAIATITAPSPISAGGGQITLIPTGIFTTTTAGNIALATTAVVNKALTMTFDVTTTKWYPSY
jgi:hypothetical protein